MNRIGPPRPPDLADGLHEPVNGPAAGLCARCVHGCVTVLQCGGGGAVAGVGADIEGEAWKPAPLTSVASCFCPQTVLRQVMAPVVRCDGYAPRATNNERR